MNLRPLAPEASALPGCATLRPTIRTAKTLSDQYVGDRSPLIATGVGSQASGFYSGTETLPQGLVHRLLKTLFSIQKPNFPALANVAHRAIAARNRTDYGADAFAKNDSSLRPVVRKQMGRSQVVRQRILIPPCGGSNPPAPANYLPVFLGRVTGKKIPKNCPHFRTFRALDLWSRPTETKLLAVCRQALHFSLDDVLQHLFIKRQVSNDPLYAAVLFFQFAQTLHLARHQTAELYSSS